MLDFRDLGRYQENNRIEAKKAQGGLPQSLWETYSAFANTEGGVILLGVAEQNPSKALEPVPLPDPHALVEEFWALVNDCRVVNCNLLRADDVQILETGGLPIVAIEVPRASRFQKPIYIGTDAEHGSYYRNGEGDWRFTPEQVHQMQRDARRCPADGAVLEQFPPAAFCWQAVSRYRSVFRSLRPDHAWNRLDHLSFLRRIGAAAPGTDNRVHPTAAGLLMFGWLSPIRAVRPHYQLDYCEPAAPRPSARRIRTEHGRWSGCLFDFYFKVCGRLADPEPPGGSPVQEALHQALAAALTSADYDSLQGLAIRRRPSGILITNSGVPHGNNPHNELLAELFRWIDASLTAGSGLPGIRAVWEAQGWEPPHLLALPAPGSTLLTLRMFPRGEAPRTAAAPRQAILDYLRDHSQGRARQMARALGLARSQVDAALSGLVGEGLVIPVGSGRSCTFRLRVKALT